MMSNLLIYFKFFMDYVMSKNLNLALDLKDFLLYFSSKSYSFIVLYLNL